MKKQVLSCIQPTGELHIGNYFGAIKNWKQLQDEGYPCIFGIVDYHAMTAPFTPSKLKLDVEEMVISLLACGINVENLFIQSLIPEHTELGWILNCITPYGELSRQTQFKDKSMQISNGNGDMSFGCGLFTYPVLQSADILLYNAELIPVGKDQEQHLELARNTAQRFNKIFKTDLIKIPQCLFTEIPKVMSLCDPTKKMSKSLGDKHYISLFETDEKIETKVRSAVTGSSNNAEIPLGVQNLIDLIKIYESLDSKKIETNSSELLKMNYKDLKDNLIHLMKSFATQLRENRQEIESQREHYIERINESSLAIRRRAQKNLFQIKDIVGLRNVNTLSTKTI